MLQGILFTSGRKLFVTNSTFFESRKGLIILLLMLGPHLMSSKKNKKNNLQGKLQAIRVLL